MNVNDYTKYISKDTLMGPNSARILEELLEKYPLPLNEDNLVLDLGCGTGLTSLIIAKETRARVYASDLWIRVEDNKKRFKEWGVDRKIFPVSEDANKLGFKKRQFDALFSVDSYHYFGTGSGFFEDKILPYLNNKAVAMIGIPGVKDEYGGRSKKLLSDWLGDEAYMFKSPTEWKEIIGYHDRIEIVKTWEMECFELAWNEWFASEHEYAISDKQFYEALIKPYTCFAGIYIKLK